MVPIDIKGEIVKKTHVQVFKAIYFFRNRDNDFTSKVVHELKPINFASGDTLYQQRDESNHIFFIYTGKIKMVCDLNDYIMDDALAKRVQDYVNIFKDADEKKTDVDLAFVTTYVEGCMFGDSDILVERQGFILPNQGRDLTATSMTETSLFLMEKKVIDEIDKSFKVIYREMVKGSFSRFKFHQARIAFLIRKLLEVVLQEDVSEDSQCPQAKDHLNDVDENEEWPDFDFEPFELDYVFRYNIKKLPDGISISGQMFYHRLLLDEMIV